MLHLSIDSPSINEKDYGYNINFTITDGSRAAYNLTGYTLKFKVWSRYFPQSYIVDAAAVIDNATAGTGHYVVQLNDFNGQDKAYRCQVELSKASFYQSTESVELIVLESPQSAF